MLFLTFILVPVVRKPELGKLGPLLIRWTGVRFRVMGWALIATLIVTGALNLAYRAGGLGSLLNGEAFRGVMGVVVGTKLLIVAAILAVTVVHDFWLGPLAGRLLQENPQDPRALRMRGQVRWIGRLNVLLTIAAVAVGVVLVRGWPS